MALFVNPRQRLIDELVNHPPERHSEGPLFNEDGTPTREGRAAYLSNQFQGLEIDWGSEVKSVCDKFSLKQLQALHPILKQIFFPGMLNEYRRKVVLCFIEDEQRLWNDLGLQIKHLIPHDCGAGNDTLAVTEDLTSIKDEVCRDQLAQTAHSLSHWKMKSSSRAYIVSGLLNLVQEKTAGVKLNALDKSPAERQALERAATLAVLEAALAKSPAEKQKLLQSFIPRSILEREGLRL